MPETSLKPSAKPIRDFSRLTPADIALILKLDDDERTQTFIAEQIGCSQSTVSDVLLQFIDTRDIAKRKARNAAAKVFDATLAGTLRSAKKGKPEAGYEFLDRIGVLEKRHPEANKGGNVNIVFGNPGQPAGPEPVLIMQQDVHTDA